MEDLDLPLILSIQNKTQHDSTPPTTARIRIASSPVGHWSVVGPDLIPTAVVYIKPPPELGILSFRSVGGRSGISPLRHPNHHSPPLPEH